MKICLRGNSIHVIEKSAFDALAAELALERQKRNEAVEMSSKFEARVRELEHELKMSADRVTRIADLEKQVAELKLANSGTMAVRAGMAEEIGRLNRVLEIWANLVVNEKDLLSVFYENAELLRWCERLYKDARDHSCQMGEDIPALAEFEAWKKEKNL